VNSYPPESFIVSSNLKFGGMNIEKLSSILDLMLYRSVKTFAGTINVLLSVGYG